MAVDLLTSRQNPPPPHSASFRVKMHHFKASLPKGLTKLAIIPNYKRPTVLCLALLARPKVPKLDSHKGQIIFRRYLLIIHFPKYHQKNC